MPTLIKRQSPWGDTLFCDDVRLEEGGKFTIVGMYPSGDIVLHGPLPALLTKLCMLISYWESPGESDEPVKIVITLPGDEPDSPAATIDLPMDQMRKIAPPNDSDARDPFLGARANIALAPVVIRQLGRIRVRAFRGEKEIPLGALMVKQAPEFASPPDVA